MTRVGPALRRFLISILPFLSSVTLASVCYVLATTLIVAPPRDFPFGLVKILPLQYWVALGCSLALLITAVLAGTTGYHWIASLFLAILVAGLGNLIYTNPRDMVTITISKLILRHGFFSQADSPFLNFPGSALAFSLIAIVTTASPALIAKSFGIAYNLIIVALGFSCFKRLGLRQSEALLAVLVVVFSFYMQGLLLHSSLMGFVFYIAIFSLVFAPHPSRATNTFLITLFFVAMVIYHAFTPLATVGAIGAMLLGWKLCDRMAQNLKLTALRGAPPPISRSILILLVVLLVTYWSYFAYDPFSWGLYPLVAGDLLTTIYSTLTPLMVGYTETTYAISYASVTRLYAPVLFLAFAIYLCTSSDQRKLQLLLWLLGLIGSIATAVSGYALEFFARIFAFAILPVSYGIARILHSERKFLRGVGFAVLLITLGLHLPSHYGQDSFQVVQDSALEGLRFFTVHCSFAASFDSPMSIYDIDLPRPEAARRSEVESYFLLDYQSGSWALYLYGDKYLELLGQKLNSTEYDKVCSSGWFAVYLQNGPR